jgi:hypothetical protein
LSEKSEKIGTDYSKEINHNIDKSSDENLKNNENRNQNMSELDITKREKIHSNTSMTNDCINNECLESENSLRKKLFSQNELQFTNQKNEIKDNTYLDDPENISQIVAIINPRIKRNKLLDEKENAPSSSQRNLNQLQVQEKPIEFNKMESNVCDNTNSTTIIKQNKKNNFKFNFFEYFWLNSICCYRKNEKINKKNILLDNSEDFCDYYLDVNTYIKKMIEIDLLKLYLIKNKDDLKAIENFKPAMKTDYSEKYNDKIEKMYRNLMNKDLESLTENIKNMETKDDRIYKEILSFYNFN